MCKIGKCGLVVASALMGCGPGPSGSRISDALVANTFDFAEAQVQATLAEIQREHPADASQFFPIRTMTEGPRLGQWEYLRAETWSSGFFSKVLWELHAWTGKTEYLEAAKRAAEGLERLADVPLDHDLGFRFLASFDEGLRRSDEGNDPGGAYRKHATEVLLRAAHALDARFNMNGIPAGAIRSHDTELGPYPVITDSIMNARLLFRGYELCGRPASGPCRTLYEHGVEHASTILAEHMRGDGSTYHVVQHNDGTQGTPADGRIHAKITDQGFASESTWSRGQAWTIYGFAGIYRFTRDDPAARPERFLAAAMRSADFFIEHLPARFAIDRANHRPGDWVPPTDFDAALGEPRGSWNGGGYRRGAPRPGTQSFTERDTAAAAIGAAGLIELSLLVEAPAARARYFRAAEDILISLLTFRAADGKLAYLAKDSVHSGVLANASYRYGAPTQSLIYADAYLLEALNRYEALGSRRLASVIESAPADPASSVGP